MRKLQVTWPRRSLVHTTAAGVRLGGTDKRLVGWSGRGNGRCCGHDLDRVARNELARPGSHQKCRQRRPTPESLLCCVGFLNLFDHVHHQAKHSKKQVPKVSCLKHVPGWSSLHLCLGHCETPSSTPCAYALGDRPYVYTIFLVELVHRRTHQGSV